MGWRGAHQAQIDQDVRLEAAQSDAPLIPPPESKSLGRQKPILCPFSQEHLPPLFCPPLPGRYAPDEFEEEHKGALAARYADISQEGKNVHRLLLESNKVLKVSKGAPTWRAYVEFINDIVIDGLARTVAYSLETLNSQLDPAQITKDELAPLLEVQLELEGSAVEYKPGLADADATASMVSLHSMVDSWIKGFFHVTKLIKRLDRSEGDFLKEVSESEQVRIAPHQPPYRTRRHQATLLLQTTTPDQPDP